MGHDNYREIADALRRRESFTGNSCHADWLQDRYTVWSYSTALLIVAHGRVIYFDNRHYSHTTSRHQALIRAAFPDATGGHSDRVVYDY